MTPPERTPQILTFEVGGRRFAVPAADVGEILRAVAITPLPGAPAVVAGMIDLRGELVPVLDFRPRLGLPERAIAPSDHLIVTAGAGRTLVLWVDRAGELVDLPASGVEAPPDLVPRPEYVAGVAKLPGGLVLITDVLRFLSATEEAALDEAWRRHGATAEAE